MRGSRFTEAAERDAAAHSGPRHADEMNIRSRVDADTDHLVELAQMIRARDAYPRVLLGSLRDFIVSKDALGAWVAVDDEVTAGPPGNPILGHVALHSRSTTPVMTLASEATGRAHHELGVVARLMVAPSARRMGLGRRLLDVATAAASSKGRLAVLDVVREDRAAIALYDRCGWTRVGQVVVELPGIVLDEFVYVSTSGTADRATSTWSGSAAHLGGHPHAGPDGTVHGSVGEGRGLRPGPVHPSERLAEQWPVAGQRAGWQVGHRAAPTPPLREPGRLDDVVGMGGSSAEATSQRVEELGPALAVGQGVVPPSHVAEGEGGEDPAARVVGRGIDGDLRD